MTGMDWSNLDQALAHQRGLLKEAQNSHLANLGLRAAREARANRFRNRQHRVMRERRAAVLEAGAATGTRTAARARGAWREDAAQWRVMISQVGSALVDVGHRLEAVAR